MTPRALPPPGHPDAPKFWMHETGGALRGAVENYLNNELMTVRDVALMRAYLVQWIDSPVWEMNPHLSEVEELIEDMISRRTRHARN